MKYFVLFGIKITKKIAFLVLKLKFLFFFSKLPLLKTNLENYYWISIFQKKKETFSVLNNYY